MGLLSCQPQSEPPWLLRREWTNLSCVDVERIAAIACETVKTRVSDLASPSISARLHLRVVENNFAEHCSAPAPQLDIGAHVPRGFCVVHANGRGFTCPFSQKPAGSSRSGKCLWPACASATSQRWKPCFFLV